jgi:hypothetical protein
MPIKSQPVGVSSKIKNPDLTIEQCRKLFKAEEYGYTDEELMQMQVFLFKLARTYHDLFATKLRYQRKVVPLNSQTYDPEESDHLRPGKYRRTG